MEIAVMHEYSDPAIEHMDLEGLAHLVIAHEGRPDNTECSISFVDDDAIAELNQEYRGKVGPTDVLSFECDGIDDEFSMAGSDDECYQLGDIVIATDVAKRQCGEYGNTLEQEIELLCVHGLLHLCGWDHRDDEEAQAMEAREQELLDLWRKR